MPVMRISISRRIGEHVFLHEREFAATLRRDCRRFYRRARSFEEENVHLSFPLEFLLNRSQALTYQKWPI